MGRAARVSCLVMVWSSGMTNRTRSFLVLVAVAYGFVLAGCRPAEVPELTTAPVASLEAVIAENDALIAEWEQRVQSGEWRRMVADGTWTGLVAGGVTVDDPASYPQTRIAELSAKNEQLRAAIDNREQ